ncbi:hypothetical protein EGW08_019787, partial [Elysia chlorotica]
MEERLKQILELFQVTLQRRRQCSQPALHQRVDAQHGGAHVHHSTAAHGGRRGYCQIGHLKHHSAAQCTYIRELDNLAAAEAELLVVVQHGVHVLDPDGVHGPIEHVPPLVGVFCRGAHSDQGGQDAVGP